MGLLKSKWFWLALIVLCTGGGWGWLRLEKDRESDGALVLYGNVDVRQSDLGFRVGGRIAELTVDEGDPVKTGEVLARLDPAPYRALRDRAAAEVRAAEAELAKRRAGNRPEEIDRARASVSVQRALLANAESKHKRSEQLIASHAISPSDFDQTLADRDEARASLTLAEAELALLEDGYRAEDIAAAEAALAAAQAQLAAAEQDLTDCELLAPADGIIQTRVLEPGTIASAGAVVFVLTLDRPLWVRAYVRETDLGRIHSGMKVSIRGDSDPERSYAGTIGFISPVAEFTPKSVETATLRTDLVYRIRIVVDAPTQRLNQGMPVTVTVPDAR